jgi:hypothetical protein
MWPAGAAPIMGEPRFLKDQTQTIAGTKMVPSTKHPGGECETHPA